MAEFVNEALIPGLPDELALRCLAKISHGFLGVVECVCKRWRDVVRSEDYASYKKAKGWCGDWLFVVTEKSDNLWIAYDPAADKWHALPRMPSSNQGIHFGFSCVSVCDRFMMVGGSYCAVHGHSSVITNEVFSFDPYRQKWSQVASMSTPRHDFACSVICGKVYVAGGYESTYMGWMASTEVYDPTIDRWEDLPVMPNPWADCFGLSYNNKYYVLTHKSYLPDQKTMEVFDVYDRRWSTVPDIWQLPENMSIAVLVLDGQLYTVIDWGYNYVRIWITGEGSWYPVGSVPAVTLPDHPRPVESFNYGVCGLKKELFVIGGKAIKLEEQGARRFDIVKLRTMRVCDPSSSPLQWRETKPFLGTACGSILGCGSLEECLH